MDQVYELGKHKMQTRRDADREEQDYDKAYENCTFKPKMNDQSKKMAKTSAIGSMIKSKNSQVRASKSSMQKDFADRMHESIQRDIERKK